jgi:hypothetical protein
MVETPISNKWQSYPINPFEENNRLRLEKSILSPNIFNVTNLSSTLEVNKNHFINHFFFSTRFQIKIERKHK